MTVYRATAVTQRDGSALANSNCRLASIATGLDFESAGIQLSTGAEMRARQSDQQGGTDSGDAAEAWASYGQSLRIRDGETFDAARADLVAGRLVHLDVWAQAAAGPCLSGTGAYGHTIAVAPELSGSRWLVADPWCSPAKWVWWDEELLRAGAETWGAQCYSSATAGTAHDAELVRLWQLNEGLLRALMRLAAKRLMSQYRPDAPASVPPSSDTGGSAGRIMFTTTGAPASETKEVDMPINAAPGLVTGIRARVGKGTDWFKDANLTQRGGSMSSDADVVYVGAPVGETVEGGSYAVQVNTAAIYADGQVRPTIIYLATADADTYSVPLPGTGEVDEALDNRDAEWRDWLLDGAPGSTL